MSINIDARGLACPEPVLRVKQALSANSNTIEVLVDNNTAVQNITRYVKNSGKAISVEKTDNEFKLTIK